MNMDKVKLLEQVKDICEKYGDLIDNAYVISVSTHYITIQGKPNEQLAEKYWEKFNLIRHGCSKCGGTTGEKHGIRVVFL
jgi:hypothetical protein